jgi:hypothetical protein
MRLNDSYQVECNTTFNSIQSEVISEYNWIGSKVVNNDSLQHMNLFHKEQCSIFDTCYDSGDLISYQKHTLDPWLMSNNSFAKCLYYRESLNNQLYVRNESCYQSIAHVVPQMSWMGPFYASIGIFGLAMLAEICFVILPQSSRQYLAIASGHCCWENTNLCNPLTWFAFSCLLLPFASQIYCFVITQFVDGVESQLLKSGSNCRICQDCPDKNKTCICLHCNKNAKERKDALKEMKKQAEEIHSNGKSVAAVTENTFMPLIQFIFVYPHINDLFDSNLPSKGKLYRSSEDFEWEYLLTVFSIVSSLISLGVCFTQAYFTQPKNCLFKTRMAWLLFFLGTVTIATAKIFLMQNIAFNIVGISNKMPNHMVTFLMIYPIAIIFVTFIISKLRLRFNFCFISKILSTKVLEHSLLKVGAMFMGGSSTPVMTYTTYLEILILILLNIAFINNVYFFIFLLSLYLVGSALRIIFVFKMTDVFKSKQRDKQGNNFLIGISFLAVSCILAFTGYYVSLIIIATTIFALAVSFIIIACGHQRS